MNYTFEPYDVLQSKKPDGPWKDYSSLRDENDAAQAVRLVNNPQHGFDAFRIVRSGQKTVVFVRSL